MFDGLIERDPCHGVQLPKVPVKPVLIFGPDQVQTLVDNLCDWWWPIATLASETGMRWGELMGLRVEDVALDQCSVLVQRTTHDLTLEATGNGTRSQWKEYPKEGSHATKQKRVALGSEARPVVASRRVSCPHQSEKQRPPRRFLRRRRRAPPDAPRRRDVAQRQGDGSTTRPSLGGAGLRHRLAGHARHHPQPSTGRIVDDDDHRSARLVPSRRVRNCLRKGVAT